MHLALLLTLVLLAAAMFGEPAGSGARAQSSSEETDVAAFNLRGEVPRRSDRKGQYLDAHLIRGNRTPTSGEPEVEEGLPVRRVTIWLGQRLEVDLRRVKPCSTQVAIAKTTRGSASCVLLGGELRPRGRTHYQQYYSITAAGRSRYRLVVARRTGGLVGRVGTATVRRQSGTYGTRITADFASTTGGRTSPVNMMTFFSGLGATPNLLRFESGRCPRGGVPMKIRVELATGGFDRTTRLTC